MAGDEGRRRSTNSQRGGPRAPARFRALQLGAMFLLVVAPRLARGDEPLRLNQIQAIGSHNSYKQAIDPALVKLVRATSGKSLDELDYAHLALTDQLNLGLLGLEIDLCNDPEGGRYAVPLGQKLLAGSGATPMPYDPDGVMREPGFKVLHIPDLDFRSHNLTFKSALAELRAWSVAHPKHLPIIVTVNLKDGPSPIPGGADALPWDAPALDALDAALTAGLGSERLLTPDAIRGEGTLEEAVLKRGWPTVDACRGKFLFVLDEEGEKRLLYVKGHPSLRGRVLFTTSPPGEPEAAVLIINDPLADGERIQALVGKGYLVRTRADAETREARTGDYSRFQAAQASGAQLISTDYYIADWRLAPAYRVRFRDDAFVRVNPVTAEPEQTAESLFDRGR